MTRIIAGYAGSLALAVPRSGTRPTSDRVREAIFSALGDVAGMRVLDLYAGSGALAIEALSRGAAAAVLVEHASMALRALRQNLAALALEDRARVIAQRVERAAPAVGRHGPFDLVLVDPPYAEVAKGRLLAVLAPYLAFADRGARLVLEHATRDAAPALSPFVLDRTRRYGETAVSSYRLSDERVLVPS